MFMQPSTMLLEEYICQTYTNHIFYLAYIPDGCDKKKYPANYNYWYQV